MSQPPSTSAATPELPRLPLWVPFIRIGSIAGNTFTELVRSKVFYIVAIFALIVLVASTFFASLTFEEQFKMLKDIALGSISIFTTLLAIAATSLLIPNDVEDRTLYTILSKPVTRLEYLLGKLFGVFLLIGTLIVIMGILSSGLLAFREFQVISGIQRDMAGAPPEMLQQELAAMEGKVFSPSFFLGMALIFVMGCVLATICLAITTITTSTIFTIICSVAILLIGNVQASAREFWYAQSQGNPSLFTKTFVGAIAVLFPDLGSFNLSDTINAGNELPLSVFFQTTGMGVFYIVLYVFIAYLIFSKKEL